MSVHSLVGTIRDDVMQEMAIMKCYVLVSYQQFISPYWCCFDVKSGVSCPPVHFLPIYKMVSYFMWVFLFCLKTRTKVCTD